jgi:hypothetical protein
MECECGKDLVIEDNEAYCKCGREYAVYTHQEPEGDGEFSESLELILL